MRRGDIVTVALLTMLSAPALAETDLQRTKFANLGLFAGYVVACGLASEGEADAMVKRLGAGLGDQWGRQDTAIFDDARAIGRKTKCEGELRKAVERGWSNYRDTR